MIPKKSGGYELVRDLNKQSTLHFKEKPKTLSEILYRLHCVKSGSYFKEPTFINGKEQNTGTARSVEDSYLLCKHYIPNIKFSIVRKAMDKLVKENILDRSFCWTIYRRVHNPGIETKRNLKAFKESLKELDIEIE